MLTLPETGFQPSVKRHNIDVHVLVDWIEASVVFLDTIVAQTDVIDVLCENGVYREQDFASIIVGDAWEELQRRQSIAPAGVSYEVDGRRIRRTLGWRDVPAYSFCLIASLQVWYKTWAKQFGDDYTEQGDLFERITVDCLNALGWETFRTGWSPGQSSKIKEIVASVADHISEPEIPGALEKWVSENANDEGLDVICSNPFSDGWGGRPVYFFQCASGANWGNKLHTPDPDTWRRIISFTTIPQRSFSIPFALLEHEFRRISARVNGILLDRYRLLAACEDDNWMNASLRTSLLRWLRPRVRLLPDDKS